MSEFELNLLISMLVHQVNLKALLPGSEFETLSVEDKTVLRTLIKDAISN